MESFDFFMGFFGLLLGLTLAEMLSRLGDLIADRERVHIGWLTPLLAIFILFDITSYWMWCWFTRDKFVIGWSLVFGGLVVASIYYLAAGLVFPRRADEWASLDDHYWKQKRIIFAGVILAGMIETAFNVIVLPSVFRPAFFVWQSLYWLPLIVLMFSRGRRVDIAMLVLLIAQYIALGSGLLPT